MQINCFNKKTGQHSSSIYTPSGSHYPKGKFPPLKTEQEERKLLEGIVTKSRHKGDENVNGIADWEG